MSKEPKWKRLGFQSDAEFRRASSARRKTQQAALAATSAENTTMLILRVMWDDADWHQPRVTTTKAQLMSKARCSIDSVKRALRKLREEGSIVPIKGFQGGRHIPTTYLLKVAGTNETPSDTQIHYLEAKRDREATWRFLKGKFGPLRALEIMGDPPEEDE